MPSMKIRSAKVQDASAICSLINYYAERGRMLHRNLESVYGMLREFLVIEADNDEIVGCVALHIFWADLAEIKSLAVHHDHKGRGLGGMLVNSAVKDARRLGVRRVFALTYEESFFSKVGFETINREFLPEKVWRECIACPKADACDEIAMMIDLAEPGPANMIKHAGGKHKKRATNVDKKKT